MQNRQNAIWIRRKAINALTVRNKGDAEIRDTIKLRLRQWCEDINRVQKGVEYDFVYVDQDSLAKYRPSSFRQMLQCFTEYKNEACVEGRSYTK